MKKINKLKKSITTITVNGVFRKFLTEKVYLALGTITEGAPGSSSPVRRIQ